ncbi:transcription factor TGAL1 isoform X4 [Zea mays]|uniref:Transcription factor TGA6 n=1 Tax=Zea mays TaxID=4577 RepID=A0A804QRZ6_MAIZE|nr:uncharacterized protein LOC100274148 isoform X4 [Zea mays]XP_035817250.1 uncharacterized protein LOC100274148 isoform X4 [Zea mays]XP_035817251.1 uncharacterized protein LOC100274148 isoform X4 [Zea mays]XP_035817252.1 uncharacterized protein LOC100274148 isoform X4 [Zea mays]
MAYASPGTDDTSTDLDTDEKNHMLELGQLVSLTASDSGNKAKDKLLGQKALRRLAQNREAARKSRLRKKAYVEQLENSRLKLSQLEQELQRARQQGIFIPTPGDDQQPNSTSEKGALAFDKDYAGWEDEHRKQISELRAALSAHAGDDELRRIVDGVMAHHHEAFRLKCVAARADAFHVLSGMWKTPVERCFMWLGGFRPSEILKYSSSQAIWTPSPSGSSRAYTACSSPRSKPKRASRSGCKRCSSRSRRPSRRQGPRACLCLQVVLLRLATTPLQTARGRWRRRLRSLSLLKAWCMRLTVCGGRLLSRCSAC